MRKLLLSITKILFVVSLLPIHFKIFAAEPVNINVGIAIEVNEIFQRWTENNACEAVIDFPKQSIPRGAIELLIFCQALNAANFNYKMNLIESGNYTRNLLLLVNQDLHTIAETIWYEQAKLLNVDVSSPIFNSGQFQKALFTSETHKLRSSSAEYFVKNKNRYVGITPSKWIYDWQAINSITPLIVDAPNQISIHKMVQAGRADFCFGEFSNNMQFKFGDITLFNIPGVKVVFRDSRHFIINKQAPNADKIYNALQLGLAKMKQSGQIKNLLHKTGFINDLANDWSVLNP